MNWKTRTLAIFILVTVSFSCIFVPSVIASNGPPCAYQAYETTGLTYATMYRNHIQNLEGKAYAPLWQRQSSQKYLLVQTSFKDTIGKIAHNYNVSPLQLIIKNKLVAPFCFYPGQRIKVPLKIVFRGGETQEAGDKPAEAEFKQSKKPAQLAPKPGQPTQPKPEPGQPTQPKPEPEQPTQPKPEPEQPTQPKPEPEQPTQPAFNLKAEEARMLELVNHERAAAGLAPLSLHPQLAEVARLKSADMVAQNYFSHQSPTYGLPFDMMRHFGISYRLAGENIALAPSVERAHSALMNSTGHRKNILNPDYTYIGIGMAQGSRGQYFTQMFIRQ